MPVITSDEIGPIVLEGIEPAEEMFTHETLGAVNVVKAWAIVARLKLPGHRLPLDAEFREILGTMAPPDPRTLARMTQTRRRQPLLFLRHIDTHTYLIDGVHRAHARFAARLTWAKAHILPPEALDEIRVEAFRMIGDRRVPLDMGALIKRRVAPLGAF